MQIQFPERRVISMTKEPLSGRSSIDYCMIKVAFFLLIKLRETGSRRGQ